MIFVFLNNIKLQFSNNNNNNIIIIIIIIIIILLLFTAPRWPNMTITVKSAYIARKVKSAYIARKVKSP